MHQFVNLILLKLSQTQIISPSPPQIISPQTVPADIINISVIDNDEEKTEIAKRHLLPKQIKENGLTTEQIKIGKPVLEKIVENYTNE